MKTNLIALCAFIFAAALPALAEDGNIQDAQDKLQATFSNYQVTDFKPSPIPGIFEVHAGPQIHYYAPEQNLLIFGQIYSSVGENLTEKSKQLSVAARLGEMPLDSAILVSAGTIPLIEISNPDCGYCKKYEQWITKLSAIYPVERKVVFMDTDMFPQAKDKMLTVICAKDQKNAYDNMMNGRNDGPNDCKEADKVLADHESITAALGVQGTPSFLLPDGSVITGFKPKQLEEYFLKAMNKPTEDK